jgi:multidrug efflux pump subunit AcrA (membrane-fusion protein)
MFSQFGKSISIPLGIFITIIVFSSSLWSQDKPKDPPPANVTVAEVKNGILAPQAEFIGTVYYQEVSDVASEISGLAEVVKFEEGQRVKKGQILVQLGSEILRKNHQVTASTYEQVLSELEIARIDLIRKEKLFKRKSIAEQTYDEERFQVIGLEKRAASLICSGCA